jgi:hypothetical protein
MVGQQQPHLLVAELQLLESTVSRIGGAMAAILAGPWS